MAPIVTIDGPAGTGKSTVALRLARHFGWRYVDSGAMYRAVALCAIEQGIPWTDASTLVQRCAQLRFEFLLCEGQLAVRVDGRDVTRAIRSQAVGEAASQVATLQSIRAILVAKQRELGAAGGLVMDGRDIGTVVLPEADLKIFMRASAEERARRRYNEAVAQGKPAQLNEILAAILERDKQDQEKPISPMVPAPDAIIIDTDNLSIDDVLAQLERLITTDQTVGQIKNKS